MHVIPETIILFIFIASFRIDPDLKSLVYCTSVREGGEIEWEFIYQLYKTATVQAEKSRLLSAMACTKKVWIINRYMVDYHV